MNAVRHERTDETGNFTLNSVTNGSYTLRAAAPVVISRQPPARRTFPGGRSSSFSSGIEGGTIANGVLTETKDGVTVEYRDDTATRTEIHVADNHVVGLQIVVRAPKPEP